jgi:hypothetical protein
LVLDNSSNTQYDCNDQEPAHIETSGAVMSPNYGETDYPPSLRCQYHIIVPEKQASNSSSPKMLTIA